MNGWLEQHKGIILTFLIAATVFGGTVVYIRQPNPPPLEISTPAPTATPSPTTVEIIPPPPTSTPRPLRVYISGEVKAPDVYLLPPGSIIKDAIDVAGGATEAADLKVVNLARELQDQQHITIPSKAAQLPTPDIIEGGVPPDSQAINLETNDRPENVSHQSASAGEPININTASLTELTRLNGIGPVIGQRIIDYRTEQGNFTTTEDIMNVRGIGTATYAKIKDDIIVGK